MASVGDVQLLDYLEKRGIKLNNRLNIAVSGGLDTVKYMISRGGRDFGALPNKYITYQNNRNPGNTRNNIEIARMLIECAKTTDVDIHTDIQKSFVYACGECIPELMEFLIENGANDWNGALIRACKRGHVDVVNFLIAKGATDFDKALRRAYERKFTNIVEILQKHRPHC